MTKSAISRQNPHMGTSTESGYRYPWSEAKWYRYEFIEKGWCRYDQSGTGTDASDSPDFCTLALLSPRFVH